MEKVGGVAGGVGMKLDQLGERAKEAFSPLGLGLTQMLMSSAPAIERLLSIVETRMTMVGQVFDSIGRSGALNEVLQSLVTGFDKLTGGGTIQGFAQIAGILLSAVKQVPAAFELALDYAKAIGHNIKAGFDYVLTVAGKTFDAMTLGAFRGLGGKGSPAGKEITAGLGLPIDALKAVPWGKLLSSPLAKKLLPAAGALGLTPGLSAAISGAVATTPLPDFIRFDDPKNPYSLEKRRRMLESQFWGDASRISAMIQQNIRPLSMIPEGPYGGGGILGNPASAAGGAVRSSIDDLLSRIEQNTKQTADRVSLREQTTGGGDLAKLGVTPAEFYSRGAGTGYRPMYSDLSGMGSELERGITKLIIRFLQQQGAGSPGHW
jgi:hypothetical protein